MGRNGVCRLREEQGSLGAKGKASLWEEAMFAFRGKSFEKFTKKMFTKKEVKFSNLFL